MQIYLFICFNIEYKSFTNTHIHTIMIQGLDNQKYRKRSSTQASNYSVAGCQVKSKYLGSWNDRSIRISLQDNLLQLGSTNSNKMKTFPIDHIHFENDPKNQLIKLQVPTGRSYDIKPNKQVMQTLSYISYFQNYKQMYMLVNESATPCPKRLNYHATIRSLSLNQDYIPEHRSSIIIPSAKVIKVIKRRPSFIKQEDWRRDEKKGGLIFINNQKKSMISKMISYIVKRVISTGSFMGISFPTFAMKPQTILQTYCKCLGAVPLILDKINSDPLQRIKAFNCLILTISLQFNDIQKPFNPTLGETFQGEIGGYPVYAQQISHHPPVSSFLLDGKNYVLHGTLQLNANLSINSAVGIFYGDVVLQFDDGGVVRGRMPSGTLSGMVWGETKFGPDGAVYSHDPINHLVSSYQVKDRDILIGNIGILKHKSYQRFLATIQSRGKQKYEKFKNISQRQFQKACWTSYVKYDGKMYFNYKDPQNFPILLTQDIKPNGQALLVSDSSHRVDIKLRADMKMEESQDEKQRIQQQQRYLRKLRDRKKGLAHRSSLN